MLPGVTVEAASPVLIEKVRSVVTNAEGRYNIVDLRPGTYVVTFTLPGFSTFRRDGIELTAGFTATVNGDLQVGTLEETITVSGATPLVDTQNVRKQTVMSTELLDTLPMSTKNVNTVATITPGFAPASTPRSSAAIPRRSVAAPITARAAATSRSTAWGFSMPPATWATRRTRR